MVKEKSDKETKKFSKLRIFFYSGIILSVLILVFTVSFYWQFENMYQGKIYPGVVVDSIPFGGKTPKEIEKFFANKNKVFENIRIELVFEDKSASVSAMDFKAGY